MACTRSVITVPTALFVLAQLCLAKSPAAYSAFNENKIWPLTGALLQSSNSEDLRVRRNVLNIHSTCPNLNNQQLRNELLIHISKEVSKVLQTGKLTTDQESGAKNTRRAASVPRRTKRRIDLSSREHPGGARKRKYIVYPATGNKKYTLKFIVNATEISSRRTVMKLWLFNKKPGCSLHSEVKVDVSDSENENVTCVDPMIKDYHELAPRSYASKGERWNSFDISRLTKNVLGNVKNVCKIMDKAKLIITVKIPKCSSLEETIQNLQKPFLEILPVSPSSPLECTSGETRCCRQVTTVSLKRLASDILYPQSLRAFYCRGTCEGTPHKSFCCVPTKTTSRSVLFFDHKGHIALNVLPDVVVEQCGCR